MKTLIISILLVFLSSIIALGQKENKLIREGNKSYEEQNYQEAEIDFRKSLQKNENSIPGRFNLGNSLYKQNNYQEALLAFDSVRNSNPGEDVLSKSYYNLGNALLKMAMDTSNTFQEALPASIEAYKSSLRSNPVDTSAKYNLAYAMNLLNDQQCQQEEQDQEEQDQEQQQEQDQDQEQQEQEQQEQNQDQEQQEQEQQEQNQDQQQRDQQQQQQQQQQAQPKQISKEDAERMLEALENDEQNTLEKLKLQKVKGSKYKSEKDW